jgi:hypothetical protein
MKPIDYIESNPTLEDMQSKALLFSEGLNDSLKSVQDGIETNHLITPVLLTDDRYGIRCDVFSEISEGKIFNRVYALTNKALLNAAQLVDMTELVALLPVYEEEI